MVKYNYSRYNSTVSYGNPLYSTMTVGNMYTMLGTLAQVNNAFNSAPNLLHSDTYSINPTTGAITLGSTTGDTGAVMSFLAPGATYHVVYQGILYKLLVNNNGTSTIWYGAPHPTYVRGTLVQSNIVAEDGTYPANGRHTDGYWYVREGVANSAPTTPGAFTSPSQGSILRGGVEYTITHGGSTDADGNPITYKVYAQYWNGTAWISNTIRSAVTSLTGKYTLLSNSSYSKVRFAAEAVDSIGAISTAVYSPEFSLINNILPVITATVPPTGQLTTMPSFEYTVTDADNNTMTVVEKIDGVIIRTLTSVTSGTKLTFTPTNMAWLQTKINQSVNVTIEATDSFGEKTTVNYPITRLVSDINFKLKNPFETDVAARRILLNIEGKIPNGAILKVEACNNAFDTNPTWEDITGIISTKLPYPFTNKVKTAAKWGISFKVNVKRGTATEEIYIDGVGGAFD